METFVYSLHYFTHSLPLRAHAVQISMDGKGPALDTIFTERLWRTVKYEKMYLQAYQSPREACQGIKNYLTCSKQQRPTPVAWVSDSRFWGAIVHKNHI